jgi:hypothetical protein
LAARASIRLSGGEPQSTISANRSVAVDVSVPRSGCESAMTTSPSGHAYVAQTVHYSTRPSLSEHPSGSDARVGIVGSRSSWPGGMT